MSSSEDKNVKLTPSQTYELLRLQALQDSQEHLVAWAKRRLWFFGALTTAVAMLGTLGVWRYLEGTLNDRIEARFAPVLQKHEEALVQFTTRSETQLERLQSSYTEERLRLRETSAGITLAAAAADKEAKLANERARVTHDEASRINEDTRQLAETADRSLSELQPKVRQLADDAEDVRTHLSELQQAQQDLGTEATRISSGLASVKASLVDSSKNRPAIFQALYSSNGQHELFGENFGQNPGRIHISTITSVHERVYHGPRHTLGDPDLRRYSTEKVTTVEGAGILEWSLSYVRFAADLSEPGYVQDVDPQGRITWMETVASKVLVETADGQVSSLADEEKRN